MKKKKSHFSRRNFLSTGALTLGGIWLGCSPSLGARAVREFVADTQREVKRASGKPDPDSWDSKAITAAWLGHSTVLMNFLGVTILTDPVLMSRIGASTPFGTLGAKRLVAPALKPADLPPIDLVLLSHAHMDHLDFATINRLPGNPQAVSARGMEDLLVGTILHDPKALGWGESATIAASNGDVHIKAFEVKHWGARWRWDRHRGYNGYIIEREGRRVIFGGDTAFTDTFKELHGSCRYEAAIMPIGAYQPWLCSHCSPEQAVAMADAAGADHFLPIHFKTFRLGREGTVEPMERLSDALHNDRIGWQDVGGTVVMA